MRTLGGDAPMDFQFGFTSGYIAFTDGCDEATTTLLLVTDNGCFRSSHGAVHVIDVVHGTHVGYVAAPGTITCPQGVTRGNPWRPSAVGIQFACLRAAAARGQESA